MSFLSLSFHLSDYRTLKHFYKDYLCLHVQKELPFLLSYNRLRALENAQVSLSSTQLSWLFTKINVFISTGSLKTLLKEVVLLPAGSLALNGILLSMTKGKIISFKLTRGNVADNNENLLIAPLRNYLENYMVIVDT